MKFNRRLEIGVWLTALYFILTRFTESSDLIQGVVLGVAAGFFLLGLLPDHVLAKIKKWKSFKS